MRILHITNRCESRAINQCLALKAAGHKVYILAEHCSNQWAELLQQVNKGSYEWDKYDVIHAHCSFDKGLFAKVLEKYAPLGKAIVYDIHDIWCGQEEDKAPLADIPRDQIIVPSAGYTYHLPGAHVVYNKVAAELWPEWMPYRLHAFVLTASVTTTEVIRDYREAHENCTRRGMPLFVLNGHDYIIPQDGRKLDKMNLMYPVNYRDMLSRMVQFDFGWADAANTQHDIHPCVTRKFWEYIACGVKPMFPFGLAWEMQELYKEIVADDTDWLFDREYTMERYSMDAELPKLIAAYETALNKAGEQ